MEPGRVSLGRRIRGYGTGRTIVVVEDDPTLRRLIVRNLDARGHTVRQAGTTAEASEVLLGQSADLLILDVNLPDGSGWGLLRELGRHGIEIPTIMMSASRVSPNVLQASPRVCFLSKPFALDALLNLVQGDSIPVPGHAAHTRRLRRV